MRNDERLTLRKTKLTCVNNIVAKYDRADNDVSASFPLRSIVDIRVDSVAEFAFPAVMISVFTALGIASKLLIENPAWNWIATIICIGICIFCLFGIWSTKIVIESAHGSVSYTALETIAEVQGFALAIKLLATAESPSGRWRSVQNGTEILLEFEGGPIEGLYRQKREADGSTLREFGHWYINGTRLQMLIMATEISDNPRFGIDTAYEIEFLDVDHLRIHGPDRENLILARTTQQLTGFEEFSESPSAEADNPLFAEDNSLISAPSPLADSASPSQS